MSNVGLVLGGGGVTGAAFHLGTLLGIQMATGWDPADASVVVGTSAGAAVAAVTRSGSLSLHSLVGDSDHRGDLSASLRAQLFRSSGRPAGMARWLRHGVLPSVRRPGWSLVLGSPGRYSADGIGDWVEERIGAEEADGWPSRPTLIVGYDLAARRRVAFGSDESPDVSLRTAVAASSAVPVLYEPVRIGERDYIDGGVASGTSVDFVLGADEPLDLVLVIAPMAADEPRPGSAFYEGMIDRAGQEALAGELERVRAEWPNCETLVIKPTDRVLSTLRPNPLSPSAAVPSLLRTLHSMHSELAKPAVWTVLKRHLLQQGHVVSSGTS